MSSDVSGHCSLHCTWLCLGPGVGACPCAAQVDGSTGSKFQSISELIATEKAARAARRGGAGVQTSEEETVSLGLRGCRPHTTARLAAKPANVTYGMTPASEPSMLDVSLPPTHSTHSLWLEQARSTPRFASHSSFRLVSCLTGQGRTQGGEPAARSPAC